jgi:hypothetical protein
MPGAGDGMPDTGSVTGDAASDPDPGAGRFAVTETDGELDPVGRSPDRPDPDPDIDDPDRPPDRDWAWVEEWRASGEPPAWAPGLALGAFVALVVGLAVLVLSTGLADLPWLAVSANLLVAAGLAPALWLSRHLPVLRWISGGAAVGVAVGWIAALMS